MGNASVRPLLFGSLWFRDQITRRFIWGRVPWNGASAWQGKAIIVAPAALKEQLWSCCNKFIAEYLTQRNGGWYHLSWENAFERAKNHSGSGFCPLHTKDRKREVRRIVPCCTLLEVSSLVASNVNATDIEWIIVCVICHFRYLWHESPRCELKLLSDGTPSANSYRRQPGHWVLARQKLGVIPLWRLCSGLVGGRSCEMLNLKTQVQEVEWVASVLVEDKFDICLQPVLAKNPALLTLAVSLQWNLWFWIDQTLDAQCKHK